MTKTNYEVLNSDDEFARRIGLLDEALSWILCAVESNPHNTLRRRTLKHHAEDLIGAGGRVLEFLND